MNSSSDGHGDGHGMAPRGSPRHRAQVKRISNVLQGLRAADYYERHIALEMLQACLKCFSFPRKLKVNGRKVFLLQLLLESSGHWSACNSWSSTLDCLSRSLRLVARRFSGPQFLLQALQGEIGRLESHFLTAKRLEVAHFDESIWENLARVEEWTQLTTLLLRALDDELNCYARERAARWIAQRAETLDSGLLMPERLLASVQRIELNSRTDEEIQWLIVGLIATIWLHDLPRNEGIALEVQQAIKKLSDGRDGELVQNVLRQSRSFFDSELPDD